MLSLLVANCGHGRRVAVPAPPARRRAAVPAGAVRPLPRSLARATALALGEIRFVERPLYDYVQHGHATLGHAAANRIPGCASGCRRYAAARASGSGCGGCTTSSTPAACSQFATVLRDALRRPDQRAQAPRARALPRGRPLAPGSRCSRLAARASCCAGGPRRWAPSGCSPRLVAAAARRDRARPPAAGAAGRGPPLVLDPSPGARIPATPTCARSPSGSRRCASRRATTLRRGSTC